VGFFCALICPTQMTLSSSVRRFGTRVFTMSISLANRTGLAVAAAGCLLVLVSLVSYQSLTDARAASSRVRQTQEALAKLGSLLSTLLMAESEVGAFLITREKDHLEVYRGTLPALERDYAALRQVSADSPDQQQRLDGLGLLFRQRLSLFQEAVEEVQANRITPRRRLNRIREGTKLREEILTLTAAIRREEEGLFIRWTKVAEASARRATGIIVGSDLLAVGLLTLAGWRILRDLAGRQRSEQLLAIQYAVVRTLAGPATLQEATTQLLRAVCEKADWDVGTFWMVDRPAGVLHCVAVWQRPAIHLTEFEALTRETTFAPGIGLPGRVWAKGEPLWVADIRRDTNLPRAMAAARGGLRAGFGFPVRLGDEVLGTLDFFGRAHRRPADDWLQMFAAIGRQVGQFIAQKRAEEGLHASEEKYRLLFERNPLPLWLFDPDSLAFLAVNDAAVRHYGYSREQFLAMTPRDIRPPEDIPKFQAALARLAVEPCTDPQAVGIWRHLKKDGTAILVEITTDWFRHQGKMIRFSLAHDVTERVQAVEALRQERDFANSLIETAPSIVLVLDPQGRVVRFNPFLGELTGYRREELQDQDWFTLVLPERDRDRLRGVFHQVLAEGHLRGFINPIVTKDGRERDIEWSAKTLKDEQGTIQGLLALGHDITDLKQAQERALQAERLAAIGQMVTGLAHESRNALQRSQACIKMLSWQVPDRPKALELIQRLQTAQNHLQHLYEGVRNYASPIRLDPGPCHLGELIQETWEHLAASREGRQAELHLDPTKADGYCEVDRFALGQVVRNILENAFGACADPVVVMASWSDAVLANRPALRLAIRDNGPGLHGEVRQRIFEPFFTTKTHGTGLGLAISKRIVEAHGGQIAVGDDDQPGAEILITLPREWP
jgi:PAS domain S-box-containing protein